jgi:PadR family transcriptional regulator AphA
MGWLMDVKTLCLGVLTFGDMTGYDIKKYFEEAFNHFFGAGYGSIYPALAELTQEGLVTCANVAQEKRPDKKVYSLTDSGRQALYNSLLRTPPRHKVRSEFLVLTYFAHLLPPEHLARIFDQREAEWQAALDALQGLDLQQCDAPGVHFAAGYGLAVIKAALDYIRNNRDALLQSIQSTAPQTSGMLRESVQRRS